MTIPKEWQVQGSFPPVGEFVRFEDIFSLMTPGGALTLDVGWLPEEDPAGSFICRLIVDNDWESPCETLRTRSEADVRRWITMTIEAMKETLGTRRGSP